jgi:hypothetical protein
MPATEAATTPAASADSGRNWIDQFVQRQGSPGWKVGDKEQSKIHVEDGMIVAAGPRSHIFTEQEFRT